MQKLASLSPDGIYRYALLRQIEENNSNVLLFVMLNPSTADAFKDDPTIRRCLGFAKREGFGWLEVVNLYGFRATDPKELLKLSSKVAIGPENYKYIQNSANKASKIIVAWGSNAIDKKVTNDVLDILKNTGREIYCLGKTVAGYPKHPLYIRADQKLILFGE